MARTLRQIIDERAGALVGRDRELHALLRLAAEDRPLVAHVHGIAGSGKSTLLRGFAARARATEATVVQLDGAATSRPSAASCPRSARPSASPPRRSRTPPAASRRPAHGSFSSSIRSNGCGWSTAGCAGA